MRRLQAVLEMLVISGWAIVPCGCSSGISLVGDRDVDGNRTDGSPPPADAEDGNPPPDTSMDAGGDTGGDAGEDADGGADGSADADADGVDAPPDGAIAHLVPDDTETFFDFRAPGSWRDSVTPMHRHAFPVAWSGGAYAVVLEDRSATTDAPGPIAVFRFERGVDGLHEAWVDEEAGATEYNSICWTGEAFVAALPTTDVGLRVLALDGSGSVIRTARALEVLPTYVPAEHGEAPVLLCPGSGAFVLDPGRGAGGLDRLYALAPDGAYSGGFVDADIPIFARNVYFAPVPCTVVADDAACATDTGLVFLRREGLARVADSLPGAPLCGGPADCDTASSGTDVVLLGSTATTWPDVEIVLARYGSDGRLLLAPVSLGGTGTAGPEAPRMRVAGSGTTVLVAQFGVLHGPDPAGVRLVGLDGAPMDSLPSIATCTTYGGCIEHAYQDGGAVVWEGDAYAVMWTTGSGVAYRRFAVAW